MNRLNTLLPADGLRRPVSIAFVVLFFISLSLGVISFFELSPKSVIVITTGPQGSQFQRDALQYAAILKRSGVKLKILTSQGSLENLQRLSNPHMQVDVGFVQGVLPEDHPTQGLVSLGSVRYQPLLIFYRSVRAYHLLSEFQGQRLVIGPEGSGAHVLAMRLLQLNGISRTSGTTLLDDDSTAASRELLAGKVDAVFFMGDSASLAVTHQLLHDTHIRLFSFAQGDAYARKEVFLNKLILPRGGLDFGKDIPDQDITLIGPTVELIARENFSPALSDLLLETARQVHRKPTLLQHRDEFPSPLQQEFPVSDSAQRYYKTGKTFLYRFMPFQLAVLIDRLLFFAVPLLVILIPGLRIMPSIYQWRIRSRLLRWYGELLSLEKDVSVLNMANSHPDLLQRLNHIEAAVSRLKVPVSFADQFYVLRQHIDYVRDKLTTSTPTQEAHGNL